ncbi:hypothetical protein JCM3765_004421 [Sporobolomyces pararoseus]
MSRPASRTSSPNRSTTRPSSSGSSSCSHSESNSHSPTRPDQPIPTSTTTPNTSITCSTQSPVPATTHYYPSPSSSSSTPWSTTTTTRVDPSYVNAPILSEYLEQNFVPSVVPLPEEYQAKEQARQYLEKLVQTISPGSKLLPFGSMANGFALKNSDMDLCCFLGKDAPVRQPSELVEQLGTLIERETNFYVKMLPRARIPIIKLNMPPTSTIPEGMACDIGFENRLALENTRLLLTYAMVDPRLRTLVLFLKVWTKRRKINNPYRGTLSSYGYVLLVIHFLSHVIKPRVVPNLQRLPLPDSTPLEDLTYQGHDISFFDDLDQLSQVFPELGTNFETSGELLIDFFKYFANGFDYAKSVISIRSEKGTLGKEEKGWNSDIEFDPEMIVRDSHKLCIEDPFALDYNVARTVTKDGLYTIRGEFMRAVRILTTSLPRNTQSGDRITAIMNELCAEREDFLLMHPPPGEHHHHHHPPHHNNHKSPLLQSSTSPFHPPSSPAPHSQQQSSAATSSLPISKSPRRRSAPSPQLRPAPPPAPHSHHLVAPPPPSNQQEYNPSPTPTSSSGRSSQINGNGVKVSTEDGTTTPASGYETRRHLQPPSYPVSRTSPVPSPSASQYHSPTPSSVSSSVAGDAVLDRRSSFENSSQTQTTLTGSGTNSTTNQYDLHRFFQNPPSSSSTSTTTTGVAPSSSSMSDHHHHQPGGYYHHHPRTTVSLTAPSSPDLTPASYYHNNNNNSGGGYHQNGGHYTSRNPYRYPSSGYPSTNSSSSSSRHASVPRNPHQHHHQQQHHHQPHYATTLNPYANPPAPAYPLASTSTSTNSGGGNSASSSSSTSPYPPYPLSSSSNSNMTPSSSAASTTTIPSTTTSGGPVVIENSNSPLLPLPPPRPIFPLEDRETIARASSITFGNFPTPTNSTTTTSNSNSSSLNSFDFLPPLPRDFAHYHALGGSNAYLSGNGGWGIQPYGMGMNSNSIIGSNGNGNVAPHSSSMMMMMMMQQQQQQQEEEEEEEQRRGGGGGKLEDQSVVVVGGGEDQEDDQDVGSITSQFDLEDSISTTTTTPPGTTTGTGESINETTRGRSFINGGSGRLEHLNHVPSSSSSHRQRGRSVPQTRMGPDGREYVLFGAIQVTLPKPEDVEAVESELERQEREQDVKGLSEEEEEDEEKEQEVVAKQEQVDQKKEEEKEEKSVIESQLGESVPTLMTSPPTPAKPAYTACRPLSPLFNATPVPTSTCNNIGVVVEVEVEEEIDLDRTPRPASPRPLPELNSSSSSSDPSTPSTPTRSKHAAKRARQNERRKVAQSSSSTPPTPASPRPLALTSNSLV